MKILRCCEVGEDCDFVASARTEEEVLKIALDHAKKEHKVEKITVDYIKNWHCAIHDEYNN